MSLLSRLSWAALFALVGADSYKEPFRPQYHFSPAKNWINDPNGLVFHKDKYHMFYQYNPTGNVWGNISWGHAVSNDLLHWSELPIALDAFRAPSGPLTELYFSGSAVVDAGRSSGFGNKGQTPLVAVYTSLYTQDMTLPSNQTVRNGQQSQSIAYSLDDGLTWSEYEGNPVILGPPSAYSDQYQNFRDPFVFWYAAGQHWVMVVSLAQEHRILLYKSSDLKEWTITGDFGSVNAVSGAWECPGLFPLPVDGNDHDIKWVLMVGINPGAVAIPQGSGTQYFIGTFDGSNFTADPGTILSSPVPAHYTVYEDWNKTSFAASSWTPTGDFVGEGPEGGTVLTLWSKSKGDGDGDIGSLTSSNFTITSKYVQFQIGCCSNPAIVGAYGTPQDIETTINLLVSGEVVRSTTGVSGGGITWRSWDVSDLVGQTASIRLIDSSSGGWGHLQVGEIVFTDSPLPQEANWVDWGPDFYAATSWNGLADETRIAIGWMNNWAYGTDIPTSPWRSAMSIPRKLELKNVQGKTQLVQQPQPRLSPLEQGKPLQQRFWKNMSPGNITLPLSVKSVDAELTFHAGKNPKETGISLRQGSDGAAIRVGYDFATAQIFVDRSAETQDVSFSNLFPGIYYAPLSADLDGMVKLRILLDWSSVEVFGGLGESAITAQIFRPDSDLAVSVFSTGDAHSVSLKLHPVGSVW
ncbi:hypothetical protein TGAMA5MH_06614 [Trichoderma gamsii]|uniref:Levanase n=1 Tax=Trichoderma gamsii TaxID=398673 RepID=A0A2K0T7L4_9HYPO|nr:hypothetical protein TGAMA5MH_06614 [Trichoderma gamsii]